MKIGTRVRIERDEKLYQSKGTWPRFRGKTGTLVEVNRDRRDSALTEYGVCFGKTWQRSDGRKTWHAEDVAWFKPYEIRRTASQRHAEARNPHRGWARTGEAA